MSDLDDLIWGISTVGAGMDNFGALSKEEQQEQITQAKQDLLNLILKALPPEEDIRPEITQWLISEDYSKGYNKALGHAEKALRKVLG